MVYLQDSFWLQFSNSLSSYGNSRKGLVLPERGLGSLIWFVCQGQRYRFQGTKAVVPQGKHYLLRSQGGSKCFLYFQIWSGLGVRRVGPPLPPIHTRTHTCTHVHAVRCPGDGPACSGKVGYHGPRVWVLVCACR